MHLFIFRFLSCNIKFQIMFKLINPIIEFKIKSILRVFYDQIEKQLIYLMFAVGITAYQLVPSVLLIYIFKKR